MATNKSRNWKTRTMAVHGGERPDPVTGASAPNLVMSTTFTLPSPDVSFSAEGITDDTPHVYSRWSNPTTAQLEEKLALLEGAEGAVVFGSGMAATTSLLLHRLRQGDRLLVGDVGYAGVAEWVRDALPKLGIEVRPVDLSDPDELRGALGRPTRMVLAETPANPILRLADIREVAGIAHDAGAELAVDSTFATPIATRPIELGADYVVHSLTKYLGGHGDALGGVVLGRAQAMAELRRDAAIHLGASLSPFNAWLILRGLVTLPLRMAAHAETALRLAEFLDGHPRVSHVTYPGLPSHPQHDLARRQMQNFGGMLTFRVEDGPAMARQLVSRLRVVHHAVSLGHHRTLVFYLPTEEMQKHSFRLDEAHLARYREWAGDGIFRLSTGLEDAEDLIEDLELGLR